MKFSFGKRVLDLSTPRVMGVLNVTPDSFSDGGQYTRIDSAMRQVELMISEGAAIIDIGGESTRPGASPVPESEELDRVCPLVEEVCKRFDTIISLDTSTAAVMREGVKKGANMINDVRALSRVGSFQAAKELDVPVCLMHMQGSPKTMQLNPSYTDTVNQVKGFFDDLLNRYDELGLAKEKMMIDPGFGFGKGLEHNLQLLHSLKDFCQFPVPVVVGLSRKSMLGAITKRDIKHRLAGSLAAATIAVYNGAHIVRAHDVAATLDTIKIAAAVRGECNE